MATRPLLVLAVGLLVTVLAAAALVPARAWGQAVLPVAVTAVLGGLVMAVVARRRPDHDDPHVDQPTDGGRP